MLNPFTCSDAELTEPHVYERSIVAPGSPLAFKLRRYDLLCQTIGAIERGEWPTREPLAAAERELMLDELSK